MRTDRLEIEIPRFFKAAGDPFAVLCALGMVLIAGLAYWSLF
jgi:hypothetical protein